MDNVLSVRDLRRNFGGVKAVDGASFDVRKGSITGLIGPNGAGKTTAFNLIAGSTRPTSGQVLLEGKDVTGLRPDQLAQLGLTRTFQLARGLSELTVIENFALYAKHQPGESLLGALTGAGGTRRREDEVIAEAWDLARDLKLAHVANNLAGDLSGGQKKLVELGRALLGHPTMLLLDEPMAGVNPSLAMELAEILSLIRDRGVTILVIEHNMEFVSRLCEHIVVLAAGKVLAQGKFDEIRANSTVQSAYLGALT